MNVFFVSICWSDPFVICRQAVAPRVLVEQQNIPLYIPYVVRGIEGGESTLDMDFMEALEGLRSNLMD